MNRDIIHNAIEGRDLSPGHVDELAEISRKYPYFSSAHLLLARAYKSQNDYRFTDQVHQAALYASDRGLLYNWVKDQTPAAVEIASLPETEKQATEIAAVLPSTSLAALLIDEEEVVPEQPSEAIPEKSEPGLTVAISPAEITPELTAPEVTAPVAPFAPAESSIEEETESAHRHVKASEIEPMEREILLEAMQSSIELEVGEEIEAAGRSEEKSAEMSDDIAIDDNSYAAYIYRRSRQIQHNTEISASEKSEEETESDEETLPAFEVNRLSHGIQRIRTGDEKSHQRELIDRFIRLEPNISRGKSTEFTPGNIARESLEEDFSLVTETMAMLFARQGKLDKARKVYKKLIELHPEKSIYFAAQLKNLDKLKK